MLSFFSFVSEPKNFGFTIFYSKHATLNFQKFFFACVMPTVHLWVFGHSHKSQFGTTWGLVKPASLNINLTVFKGGAIVVAKMKREKKQPQFFVLIYLDLSWLLFKLFCLVNTLWKATALFENFFVYRVLNPMKIAQFDFYWAK